MAHIEKVKLDGRTYTIVTRSGGEFEIYRKTWFFGWIRPVNPFSSLGDRVREAWDARQSWM